MIRLMSSSWASMWVERRSYWSLGWNAGSSWQILWKPEWLTWVLARTSQLRPLFRPVLPNTWALGHVAPSGPWWKASSLHGRIGLCQTLLEPCQHQIPWEWLGVALDVKPSLGILQVDTESPDRLGSWCCISRLESRPGLDLELGPG